MRYQTALRPDSLIVSYANHSLGLVAVAIQNLIVLDAVRQPLREPDEKDHRHHEDGNHT